MAESRRASDAATATLDAYLQALRQSGLVEISRLDGVLAEFKKTQSIPAMSASAGDTSVKSPPTKILRDPSEGAAFGRFLVGKNLITAWQHRMILEGRFRGFFLGRYRLLRFLGAGGMSQVYLAEHTKMHRRVAIKVLSTRLTREPGHLERFLVEARAIAALDHPNIIHAFNVDNDGGVYYLVMQYIEGHDLSRIVEVRGPLAPERAAEYIRQAAEGLAHAHARGLIHRDVKPGNLMVDRGGTVKIADLGLALQLELADNSLTRALGQGLLGTTDYLAPEQAIDCHSVDARADIYSLGCTLYFLLTGRPPFPEGTMAQRLLKHQSAEPASIFALRADAPFDLVAICARMMAKKPDERYQNCRAVSTALAGWIASRSSAQTSIQRNEIPEAVLAEGSSQSISQVMIAQVCPDDDDTDDTSGRLDAAVTPPARPISTSQPTIVSSATISDMYARRRRKSIVINLVLCAAAAVAVSAGVWVGIARLSTPAGDHAIGGELKGEKGEKGWIVLDWPAAERAGARLMVDGKPLPIPADGAIELAAESGARNLVIVRPGFPVYERTVTVAGGQRRSVAPWWGGPEAPAVTTTTVAPPPPPPSSTVGPLLVVTPPAPLGILDRLSPTTLPAEIRPWADSVPVVAAWGDARLAHWTPIRTLAMSRKGALASISQDAQLKIWSADTQTPLVEWTPAANEFAQVIALEFSSDGRWLASLEVPSTGKPLVRVRSTATGAIERTMAEGVSASTMTFVSDDDILVTAGSGGVLQWWNTRNGKAGSQAATPFAHVRYLAASHSGKWLAVSGYMASKPPAPQAAPGAAPAGAAATADNAPAAAPQIVRAVQTKGIVLVLDAVTREVRHTLEAHDGQIMGLKFAAGDTLATTGTDGKLRLWNAEQGEPTGEIEAHTGPITAMVIDAAGKKAATYGGPGALVKVWDLETKKLLVERTSPALGHVPQRSLEFSPDGQLLFLASGQECRIAALSAATLEAAHPPALRHDASVMSAAWQPDGRLLSADVRGRVLAWNPATGLAEPHGKTALVSAASPSLLSPRGDTLATMSVDQTLRLVDTSTGEARASIGPGMLLLTSPSGWAFSSDGSLLAASWYNLEGKNFTLSVWNARTGVLVHSLPTPTSRVVTLTFSPDGKQLAAAAQNAGKHEVALYDTAGWTTLGTVSGHANLIYDLSFSADSTRLATASLDGTARLWKLPEGTPLASLPHESPVVSVSISPDGARLATLARHGALKVWSYVSATNTLALERSSILYPTGSPTQFSFGPGASPVQRLMFAPDGRHLAATCANGAIYVVRTSK